MLASEPWSEIIYSCSVILNSPSTCGLWHLAKNISNPKAYECIRAWIKLILTHFWIACENCEENGEKLVEMYHSCLLHIANVHKWPTTALKRLRRDNLCPHFETVLQEEKIEACSVAQEEQFGVQTIICSNIIGKGVNPKRWSYYIINCPSVYFLKVNQQSLFFSIF